ncbi:hypothetical protein [Deinococcus hohokamensis]|uniref:Uncharacterized protein n=1 Tax=Deinococcus hohokamensis TaxID=309883 RepID=A0ABV9I6G7_9DEIO
MPHRFRFILVSLTHVQLLGLECLNDTWIQRHDPAALAAYPPAQRPAHAPIRRAAAWARTGDPRALALMQGGSEALCLLMGVDIAYWDAEGQGLFLPGLPGLLDVVLDDGEPPVVRPDGETCPYYAISGAVAIRPASDAVSAFTEDPHRAFDLVILEGDPATLDGLSGP